MHALKQKTYTTPHTELRWPLQHDVKVAIFIGESGIGKTVFAQQHFPDGCLLVRHLDQLADFHPRLHQGIVFDDMTFTHLPKSTQIFLTDHEEDGVIHIRYGMATIPAGTPRIFTTNPDRPVFDYDYPAIKRRIKKVNLKNLF